MQIKNILSKTDLSGVFVIYKGSTTIETPETYGLSHFVEHLMYKQVDHMLSDFNKYGINANAYTDNNYIVYYITGLNKYVDKFGKEFLSCITSKMELSDEDFEKEKKIIIEEYNRSFCSSDEGFFLNTFRKNFNYYSPIGELSAIKNTTKENLLSLYETQYKQPFMVVNISSSKACVSHLEELPEYEEIETTYKHQAFKDNNDFIFQEYTKSDSNVNIINHSNQFIDIEDMYLSVFINKMLASDLTSPLYKVIREEHGLVYGLNLYNEQIADKYVVCFETQTGKQNLEKLNGLFTEILSNPDKYITEELFDNTKLKIGIEKEILEIEQYKTIRNLFSSSISYGNNLDKITLEKVMEHYNKYYKNVQNTFIFNNN